GDLPGYAVLAGRDGGVKTRIAAGVPRSGRIAVDRLTDVPCPFEREVAGLRGQVVEDIAGFGELGPVGVVESTEYLDRLQQRYVEVFAAICADRHQRRDRHRRYGNNRAQF